jgi:hypothetical protein
VRQLDAISRELRRLSQKLMIGGLLLSVVVMGRIIAMSLSGNESHFLLHLVVAIPVLVLVWLLAKASPPARRSRAAKLARSLLLTGLSLFGGGALIEAIGALGYSDSDVRTNDLALLHSLGVVVTPLGIVLALAGTITSWAVAAAARRGVEDSRYVAAGVVLAAIAALTFVAGGFIFGY